MALTEWMRKIREEKVEFGRSSQDEEMRCEVKVVCSLWKMETEESDMIRRWSMNT